MSRKIPQVFIFLIWKCLTLSQIFSVIQSNRYNRIIDNMRIIGKMNRSTFSGFLVTSDNTTLCVWDFLQYFLANSLACLLIEHYYWSTAAQFGLAPVRSAERDETCSNPGRAGPTLRVLNNWGESYAFVKRRLDFPDFSYKEGTEQTVGLVSQLFTYELCGMLKNPFTVCKE